MTQVKEIMIPPIKDDKDEKVTSNKLNILDSDVANAIDGAVSASLNNKFAAASENLEKLLATRMDQIESKFSKLFGNDMHASTSNTEKKICGSASDDISNLQIPKFPPPPEPSLKNIHSRTTIGYSAGEGNSVPSHHASAYSTPPPQATCIPYGPMPNNAFGISVRHTYASPNQPPHVTYSSPQHNPAPNRPRAEVDGFREEMIDMFRQTFGIDPKAKSEHIKNHIPRDMSMFNFRKGLKFLNLLSSPVMIVGPLWSI